MTLPISEREGFDAIEAFDVLEHIEDDCWVLKEIYRADKRGSV